MGRRRGNTSDPSDLVANMCSYEGSRKPGRVAREQQQAPVAQLVEQEPFKLAAEGSSPSGGTLRRCARHGVVKHFRAKNAKLKAGFYWRCTRCSGEAVLRRKQKVKRILVEEAGGRCRVCGYDAYVGNLVFHHVDPSQKSFQLSSSVGRSLAAFREEAKKCVLVCANCHGEIEAGLIESPRPTLREVPPAPMV